MCKTQITAESGDYEGKIRRNGAGFNISVAKRNEVRKATYKTHQIQCDALQDYIINHIVTTPAIQYDRSCETSLGFDKFRMTTTSYSTATNIERLRPIGPLRHSWAIHHSSLFLPSDNNNIKFSQNEQGRKRTNDSFVQIFIFSPSDIFCVICK